MAIASAKRMITNLSARIKALPLRRLLLTILSLFSVLVIILLIWKVPKWQAKSIEDVKDRATIENAARGTFVQALGGLFLFITAYFTSQNLKVTQQNLIATQEKQVTERFAKAIEQLGNASIHVRLGAIYALERISKDSDKDYWQVMEILTAYVRETSPYPPRDKAKNQPLLESILNNQPNTISKQKDIPPIGTDILAVLTIIIRRKKSYEASEENRLDLSKTDLNGANLGGANLSGVNLGGANLRDANLSGANLSGGYAYFRDAYANFRDANLIAANLRDAYLYLNGANLSGANLSGANLSFANLSGANLSGANFSGANLSFANLSGANLRDANLSDASLRDANLSDANLSDANLSGAKNLIPKQVKQARNWAEARYDKEFCVQLNLPPKTAESQEN